MCVCVFVCVSVEGLQVQLSHFRAPLCVICLGLTRSGRVLCVRVCPRTSLSLLWCQLGDVDLSSADAAPDLVSILLGYVYDHRQVCGDATVESGWQISTLAPALCWLEGFPTVREAVMAGYAPPPPPVRVCVCMRVCVCRARALPRRVLALHVRARARVCVCVYVCRV